MQGKRSLPSILIALIFAIYLSMPVGAFSWQTDFGPPFSHDAPFTTSISGGDFLGAVDYGSYPNYRMIWGEGEHLTWTDSAINSMRSGIYCRDNSSSSQCGGTLAYYETGMVFHTFAKNTNTYNHIDYDQYLSGSDFPGVEFIYKDYNEVRMYIGDPNSMSSSTEYYSYQAYYDSYYNPPSYTGKQNGEMDYSTYRVYRQPPYPDNPLNKDDNAKICINDDAAVNPTGSGACA